MKVAAIKAGSRYRRDLGDIDGLAASIKELGLLHPVVVTPDGQLIAGLRRLEACKRLGWQDIPVTVVDMDAILRGECAENVARKDFTPTEAVDIGRALEDLESRRAKERQREAGVANLPTVSCGKIPPLTNTGKTRDKVGAAVGMSGRNYEMARAVVKAAEESPGVNADLPWLMDKQGVAAATREMKRRQIVDKLETIAARQVEPIVGVFDVIVVDPPWPMERIERDACPAQPSELEYPLMSLADIEALSLPMAADCHVWLWTTQKFLPAALRVLDCWGLKYVCAFVWHKPGGFQPFGLPQYNCEFALYARKGSPVFIDTKAFSLCFNAPRGAHSEKPAAFYELVRRVTAGRRLDMFSRRPIEGFVTWGKEAR